MSAAREPRVFPFLGDPVAQARSPALFNDLFSRNRTAAVVVPMRISAERMPGLVRELFKAGNTGGISLTNPHKAAMLSLVDRCDLLARLAGGINAVRLADDGALEGTMLDGTGMVKALDHFGVAIAGHRVMVVGVGRAGRAIAAALAQRSPARLTLVDCMGERSRSFAYELREHFELDIVAGEMALPAGHDLVINATALGTHAVDALPFDVALLDAGATVMDVIMGTPDVPLLKACAARGITAFSGHEMLVQQVPDYLRFFGMADLAACAVQDLPLFRQMLSPQAATEAA